MAASNSTSQLLLKNPFGVLAARRHTMSLTLSNVKILANLAQLELTDDQAARSLTKLNDIFALVEQMQSVDTTGIAPLNHPIAVIHTDLSMRLRDDIVSERNHREAYQQPAPATQDGLYLVPKVLD